MQSVRQLSLKGRALRLLAAREHSRAELERKLAEYAESAEQLNTTLNDLQAKGFIDEQRVVDSVLYRRASKLGAQRIRQELQAKGLAPEAVQAAVGELKATELERAAEVWRKKFGQTPSNPAERMRQQRFLLSRGFASEVVAKLLKGAIAPLEE